MKRTFGLMASNWLRKPQNQEKIKRTARQLWERFQKRKGPDNAQPNRASPAQRDHSHGRNTDSRKDG